jgi:hypothetical protein
MTNIVVAGTTKKGSKFEYTMEQRPDGFVGVASPDPEVESIIKGKPWDWLCRYMDKKGYSHQLYLEEYWIAKQRDGNRPGPGHD